MEILLVLLSLPLMFIGGFALDGASRGDEGDDAEPEARDDEAEPII